MNTQQILAKLVAFNTTSNLSNLPLVDWIKEYLAGFGITSLLIADSTGQKANLYARIGPQNDHGYVLSGHTDVVPVDGQNWSSNPFELTTRDTRLFGRGTADMKGFLACVLASVPHMIKADLKKPIHLAFSYDEEVGCLGTPDLVAAIPKAEAVIVGEPTGLKVMDRHKGGYSEAVTFEGIPAHSSLPQLGVNAIDYSVKFMSELLSIAEHLKTKFLLDFTLEPNYSTLGLAKINGGVAANIVPEHTELTWFLRTTPFEDTRQIVDRIHKTIVELKDEMCFENADCNIVVKNTIEISPLKQETSPIAAELCLHLSGQSETFGVSYGTEAGKFQELGYSVAICGPGNIVQAHKPDEFIEISQLTQCEEFLMNLIVNASQQNH